MGDITFFTIPRAFEGAVAVRQANAIESWLELGQVVLFGDDVGIHEFARQFGCKHVSGVLCGGQGTPFVSDAFAMFQARFKGSSVFLNADVILPDDGIVKAMQAVEKELDKFLLVGRRTDFYFDERIDSDDPLWRSHVREAIVATGSLHGEWGVDYMGFISPLWGETPQFYIGRIKWDTYYVAEAARLGAQLVEATDVVLAAHPVHGYEHLPGGEMNEGNPEVAWNIERADGQALGVTHTHYILDRNGLRKR